MAEEKDLDDINAYFGRIVDSYLDEACMQLRNVLRTKFAGDETLYFARVEGFTKNLEEIELELVKLRETKNDVLEGKCQFLKDNKKNTAS